MPLFEWKPLYSVGIALVDGQHQKLIGCMNSFHEAQAAGKAAAAKLELAALLRFTKIHFTDEEGMMQRNGYPDFPAHQAAHHKLLEIVEKLAKTYMEAPTPANGEKMGNFLKTWLANHILGIDKKYSPFMHEHGVA